MAEYSYTNSAKRRQRKQFSPERRQWPEGKKWQSSVQTLPELTSADPVLPSASPPADCPWIIIGQIGLRLFR